MRKIDYNLKKSFILSEEDSTQECLVYCFDINKAKKFLSQHHIAIISEYTFIDALIINAKFSVAEKLSKQDFVKFLSSTSKAFALIDVSKKILGVDYINGSGKGITVAVIDTGISCHLDFVLPKNRIKKFVDLISEKDTPYDDNGHGTFVAGIIGGNGTISNGKYAGIAPCVDIVSIKALNSKGEGNAVQILNAMQWVYDNHKKYNINVVCMSFGSEPLGYTDPIMKGAEKLWSKGIVVVAAAGNSGPKFQTIKSPGISSKIITVGGMNDNRNGDLCYKENFTVADFSSRGPALTKTKPDLVAPSVDITSCGLKNFYTTLSGTSVATPMIAGICAKLLSNNPKLSPDQIKRFLLFNCKSIIYGQNKKNIEGCGYPDFNKKIQKKEF